MESSDSAGERRYSLLIATIYASRATKDEIEETVTSSGNARLSLRLMEQKKAIDQLKRSLAWSW